MESKRRPLIMQNESACHLAEINRMKKNEEKRELHGWRRGKWIREIKNSSSDCFTAVQFFWSANKRASLSGFVWTRTRSCCSVCESRQRGSWRWWFYICLTSLCASLTGDYKPAPPRPYADLSIWIDHISIRVQCGGVARSGWLFFVMPETHRDEGIVKISGRVLSNASKRSYAQPGFVQFL